MVDGVLEHSGNRAVVFGCHEQQRLGTGDLGAKVLDHIHLVAVRILVVQRQVVDGDFLELETFGCHALDRLRELAIEGILAQAADDDSDLVLAHENSWDQKRASHYEKPQGGVPVGAVLHVQRPLASTVHCMNEGLA
ncbi:hypothetical protein D3C78_1463460 [compost metagenome]